MHNPLHRLVIATITLCLASPCARAGIIYVNQAATGANNGTSWTHAFRELRTALQTTGLGDQVWVAAGTYRPAPAGGSTTASFPVWDVRLFGGFNGTESSLEQRNWRLNVTTLSGDLSGDDGEGFGGSDNSKVILRVIGPGDSTIDGFTIVGGNSSPMVDTDLPIEAAVQSFYLQGGRLVIVNCLFTRNSGRCVVVSDHWAIADVIANCVFRDNRSAFGAVLANPYWDSDPFLMIHCTMTGNQIMPGWPGPSAAAGADVRNSILWANASPALATLPQDAQATARYSDIQGGFPGQGNIDMDPLFVNLGSSDNHLLSGSPCIDAGSNLEIPAWLISDYDGNSRRIDEPSSSNSGEGDAPIADMGAYEFLDCNGNGQPDTVDIATGAAADINGNSILDVCEPTGTAICIGDGSGHACPCANQSPPGFEAGCTNSSASAGRLTAFGMSDLLTDTLVLSIQGLGATATALYFQGDALDPVGGVGGLPFGDGLKCVYGSIRRLGIRTSVNGACMFGDGVGSDPLVSVRGEIPPWGGPRHYQVWYRDAVPFCTPAGHNLSNALTIVWAR